MLLTTRQLIEMSGRSKGFVYKTLKAEGIELSDFYDDSVLRYFKKDVPDGLLTLGQICRTAGISSGTASNWLHRAGIKADLRIQHEYFYSRAALDFLVRKKSLMDAGNAIREKEKSERQRIHLEKLERASQRQKPSYYFVSVRVPFNWRIVACSLSYLDARMIADELNALGIRAHFRSHAKA